jgi:membrane-bound serine protease (ClpP class)
MAIFFILVLIFFGIALIVLEILIVPGLIVGIAGGVFMFMGIMWAWQVYGNTGGIIVGMSSLVVLAISIYLALKSGFWQRFSLKDKLDGKVNVILTEQLSVGDFGDAVSSLRPMGTVRVNGQQFEATSEGQMIPPNYPIEIVRIEENKVFVKARN